jgi:hypothetical protein
MPRQHNGLQYCRLLLAKLACWHEGMVGTQVPSVNIGSLSHCCYLAWWKSGRWHLGVIYGLYPIDSCQSLEEYFPSYPILVFEHYHTAIYLA